jgi:hypothetical protein
VWELLHQRRIAIMRAGAEVPENSWQPLLLSLETWTREAPEIVLRPPGP